MKKNIKNIYVPPQVEVELCQLELNFLIVSATVPGATADDAEEEEWTVS